MFSSRPATLLYSSQMVNNENATTESKTTTTASKDPTMMVHKTPAGTKSRRAFGDISNKRPQKHHEEGEDEVARKATAVPQTPAHTLKKSSKKSAKKTSVCLFTNLDTKRGVSFADKLENVNVVPSVPANTISGANETAEKTFCEDDENSYDEPEKPLGRTYQQQWENGDHDDDETVLSLEGLDTIAKTWKKVDEKIGLLQPLYEKEFHQHIAEFDQEIEEFGKQEGALGLVMVYILFFVFFILFRLQISQSLSLYTLQQNLASIFFRHRTSRPWFRFSMNWKMI